jgi:3-isopropylmalate dehydrogenase
MLLEWLGARHGSNALSEAADLLQKSIDAVLADPKNRTPDLGGSATTAEMGEAVAGAVKGK